MTKRSVIRKGALIGAVALAALPTLALAACTGSTSVSGTLQSPSCFTDFQTFVANALKVFVNLSLPVIGFFIVFVGYKFVAAQGNSNKIKEAKTSFLYVIIGSALVLGAWVIANVLASTVTSLLG